MKSALRSLHSLLTLKRQRAVSSEQITSVLKSSTLWRRVPILRRHNNSVKDRGKAFLAATSCHYCALFSLGGDFRPSQFPFPLSAAHLNFPEFSSGRRVIFLGYRMAITAPTNNNSEDCIPKPSNDSKSAEPAAALIRTQNNSNGNYKLSVCSKQIETNKKLGL